MQSFIIRGESEVCYKYRANFIAEHNIAPYNILEYPDTVKIADVRALQKMLNIKRTEHEKFLLSLSGDITLDAQNALLKTLEEVPDNVYIFILAGPNNELLPTVMSRCQQITVATIETSIPNTLPSFSIDAFERPTYASIAQLIDTLSDSITIREYDLFITKTRALLLSLDLPNSVIRLQLIKFLHKLFAQYSLVKKNNVNARLAIEHAYISVFL
jgi:hypothetical protein